MNSKGNILLNTMMVLMASSIFFISISRSNIRIHNFETMVFERDIPVTYFEYTIDLFDEDMNDYFEYYIDNPTAYDSASFKRILKDRIEGLSGFSYKRDDIQDNELDFWDHFGQIIQNNGYKMNGTDTYVIGIELPGYEAEYQIDLSFEKTWEYKGYYFHDLLFCYWGNRGACRKIQNPKNYNVVYSFNDDSRGTLTTFGE